LVVDAQSARLSINNFCQWQLAWPRRVVSHSTRPPSSPSSCAQRCNRPTSNKQRQEHRVHRESLHSTADRPTVEKASEKGAWRRRSSKKYLYYSKAPNSSVLCCILESLRFRGWHPIQKSYCSRGRPPAPHLIRVSHWSSRELCNSHTMLCRYASYLHRTL